MKWIGLVVVLVLGITAGPQRAAADTRRVVLVAGNNTGFGSDVQLRYAERDASRVASVFREIGQADHIEELLGADAHRVLARLRTLQTKMQLWRASGDKIFFLFYYSGHGNDRGLRMGRSELSTEALLTALRAMGADVRFAVIDACESGAFTRTKGVQGKQPTSVALLDRIETHGEVIMASTSRGEAAQESEALKGSFFTSYWLTGLRGSADRNSDGVVGMSEAYEYAYDRTLVSTVVSAAGMQRPTFSTRLAGREDVSLTWPRRSGAQLRFRAYSPGTFLVLSKDEGNVLVDLPVSAGSSSSIALAPGTYVVKKRSPRGLFVALVRLKKGSDALLDESQMSHVPYAVLVEKGASAPQWLTASAGSGTQLLGHGFPYEMEVGYLRGWGRYQLWGRVGASLGGGRDSVRSTLTTVRPSVTGLQRRTGFRWDRFHGVELSVPLHLQTIDGGTRMSLGAGVSYVLGGAFHLNHRTSLLLRVSLGFDEVHSQTTDDSDDAGWKPTFRSTTHLGAEVRF